MKKRMIGGLTLFLMILAVGVLAKTPEENFQIAGQNLLYEKESELYKLLEEIDKYLNDISADSHISAFELTRLSKKIENFEKIKEKADKELKLYNLKTKTLFNPEYKKIIQEYRDSNYQDNDQEDIRAFFVKRTGRNIIIGSGPGSGYLSFSALLATIFFWLFLIAAFIVDNSFFGILFGIFYLLSIVQSKVISALFMP